MIDLTSWSPMPKQTNVTVYLTCTMQQEGDWYVTECTSLPVATQGKTDSEAMANMIEAIKMFLESCIKRNTLEKVLLRYKWRPRLNPPRDLPSKSFSLPVPVPPVLLQRANARG